MAVRKTASRSAPSAADPATDFAEPPYPAPHHDVAREDRWNKFKLAEFLRALAATQCVSSAAKAAGFRTAHGG